MSYFINLLKSLLHNMLQIFSFGKKRLTNSLSVYIKSNTGNTLTVDLDPKWDIKNVKEIVAPQLGLEPDEVKIIFAGKELHDSTTIEECDLGQQSILHAVKAKRNRGKKALNTPNTLDESTEESSGSKPMNETLMDLQLSPEERKNITTKAEKLKAKAHFYVYCGTCKSLQTGKLRVRCGICKSGAFTVDRDPTCWNDVLEPKQITGLCEDEHKTLTSDKPSSSNANPDIVYGEFYFKCGEHPSQGEGDQAVPLYLIKPNFHNIPCIACTDICDPVFVFPCEDNHLTCLDCFRQYSGTRVQSRGLWPHETYGYTIDCPVGCKHSYIKETHHFRLLNEVQYALYQRFGAEEFVLRNGGVMCPQAGCGMGILIDEDCQRIRCGSCGYSWNRNENSNFGNASGLGGLWQAVEPNNANRGRWVGTDKSDPNAVNLKPCPKCGVPTERDGGCMHMICGRAACKFNWCWVCHAAWTRECMASHWFD